MSFLHAKVASRRAYTLVELLIVVAMVGVLAALAMVGYSKYLSSAGATEAAFVIQRIRGSEEGYKAENSVYLGCSGCSSPTGCVQGTGSLSAFYPMPTPNKSKYAWGQPSHSDYACWRLLNVTTDGPVRFGYAVVAGLPGPMMPVPEITASPNWPTANEPWYIVLARGDRDANGKNAYFAASSLTGELYSENASE